MNFIERAVKALEEAHDASRHGNPEAARSHQQAIEERDSQSRAGNGLEVIDTNPGLPGRAPDSGLRGATLRGVSIAPTTATDPAIRDKDSRPAQTDSPDDTLHRDDVDTYTGAVFRNSADRVRAAHVRALRAKIDQVEASQDEAPVSLPSGFLPAAGGTVPPADTIPAASTAPPANTLPSAGAVKTAAQGVPTVPARSTLARRTATPDSQSRGAAATTTVLPPSVPGASAAPLSRPPATRPAPTHPASPFESASGRTARAAARGRDSALGPVSDGGSGATTHRATQGASGNSPDTAPDTSPDSTLAVDSAIVDMEVDTPAGGRLRLKSIRATAYLDPKGQEDRMRETFEPMADELLEQIFADGTAQTSMGRRLMLTSVAAGAGRSLCAMHLALSLVVDHNQSVTYVDMDFGGSSIIPLLGVKAGRGVADWLDGQIQTLDALVVPTELPGLRLIGAGTAGAVERAGQTPDRQSINAILLALGSRYPHDLVIIDAPPLLGGENATMLAGLSGQVIVVVEANATPRRKLREALARLERHSKVMVMLNKVS